jgi:serine/threonine protein kinase
LRRAGADPRGREPAGAPAAPRLRGGVLELAGPFRYTPTSVDLGANVPGYRLLRLVGSGAVATIYLAEGSAGERVAVKFVNAAAPSGSRAAEELRHEFKVLSMLSHPSIP